jgi:hypothetical protein
MFSFPGDIWQRSGTVNQSEGARLHHNDPVLLVIVVHQHETKIRLIKH